MTNRNSAEIVKMRRFFIASLVILALSVGYTSLRWGGGAFLAGLYFSQQYKSVCKEKLPDCKASAKLVFDKESSAPAVHIAYHVGKGQDTNDVYGLYKDTIHQSHRRYRDSWLAKPLPPLKKFWMEE